MTTFFHRRDLAALALLFALCTFFWARVLFTDAVLLPDYLGGFAPFGANEQAAWNILRWDALGQYFPWRHFAASQLAQNHIPLWNPHQFAGTPFVANGQSAVFYPLSLPFWLFDTARAFGISAWLHSLLAAFGIFFLAREWKFSRASGVLAAVIFTFGGYLTTWVSLPTLSNTASWLPLLLWLFERARNEQALSRDGVFFALSFACALLAGHPQIFFYCGLALALRALLCPQPMRAFKVLAGGSVLCLALAAIQILPTLELARAGHRAAQGGPTMAGWNWVRDNALPASEYLSLVFPFNSARSYAENFGYVGIVAALFATGALGVGILGTLKGKRLSSEWVFAATLCIFGLLFALATPLAQGFYFAIPGLSQMGGTGRAFVLWNLGVALLAAFALEMLRNRVSALASRGTRNSTVLVALVCAVISLELFAANWNVQPTAPRAKVYPATALTRYLQTQTKEGGRILFITPRGDWFPGEYLRNRTHPRGVLPPNGAMVYGLNDVNGYDSLSLLAYRNFVGEGEPKPSPDFNGNMILLQNPESSSLDALDVRWVVSLVPLEMPSLSLATQLDRCFVYRRNAGDAAKIDGSFFTSGWRELSTAQQMNLEQRGVAIRARRYEPQSFRLGAFVSLCALVLCAALTQVRAQARPKSTLLEEAKTTL